MTTAAARTIPDAARDLGAWTASLFHAIDAKDTAGFLAHLTPDATFSMGNFPPATGTAAMTGMLDNFFGMVESVSHTVDDAWTVPGHVVCRGMVTYVRKDARRVTCAYCNVLRLRDGKVDDYRIYVDPSPLLAP